MTPERLAQVKAVAGADADDVMIASVTALPELALELLAEVERLREALRRISEGDIPDSWNSEPITVIQRFAQDALEGR